MKTLSIRSLARSRRSIVEVGSEFAWQRLKQWLQTQANYKSVFLVTDTHLFSLYRSEFEVAANAAPPKTHLYAFEAGEVFGKSRSNMEAIQNFVVANGGSENSVLVALGGGVVGDVVGFAAATLFRGVDYLQVPTTTLSMVDSSVGGKTAINHPLGKNCLGAFHMPQKVWVDVGFAKTLPDREFVYGLVEVAKIALMLDKKFVRFLGEVGDDLGKENDALLSDIVAKSIALKAKVVRRDFWNANYRHVLNFGHTTAHAIEVLSQYKIAHGEAVFWGILAEAFLSKELSVIPESDFLSLQNFLKTFRPFKALFGGSGGSSKKPFAGQPVKKVVEQMASDKKNRRRGCITMPLIAGIGKPGKGRRGFCFDVKFEDVFNAYMRLGR